MLQHETEHADESALEAACSQVNRDMTECQGSLDRSDRILTITL